MQLCVYVYLKVCLLVCLPVCFAVFMFVYNYYVYRHTRVCLNVCFCLSAWFVFVYASLCLSEYLPVNPGIRQSLYIRHIYFCVTPAACVLRNIAYIHPSLHANNTHT